MTIPKPLDATLWDEGIPVAEDFYGHVNARWLAANPVPAEYPMWGAYVELDHRNKERTRRLLEAAAQASADAEPITRLVGDFYASGMDEAAIAAVNVRLTLGENIADLGGIAISLDAMRDAIGDDAPLIDGLTPEQRFFLAYATTGETGMGSTHHGRPRRSACNPLATSARIVAGSVARACGRHSTRYRGSNGWESWRG